MELLGFICVIGAFALGWVLGYYDIPNLKLSQEDARDDNDEDAALAEYRSHKTHPHQQGDTVE